MDIHPVCIIRDVNISQFFSFSRAEEGIVSNWIPNKWNKKEITYAVTRDSLDLVGNTTERIMVNLAMTQWEVELDLKLIPVKAEIEKPDIDIQWVTSTMDPYFKKDSGILAYAGYPQTSYQGILRMNEDKIWSPDGMSIDANTYFKLTGKILADPNSRAKTYNANQTLAHEIGHLLGAVHVEDCSACLMFPYYNGTISPQLKDLAQLYPKYGARNYKNPFGKINLKTAVENRRKNWDGKWKYAI